MGFHCSVRVGRVAAIALVATSIPMAARAQVVIRGVLYDDASGSPVSGAVMLIDPRTDAAVVHAATDSVGGFSLQAGEGIYQLAAVRPGWVSVLSAPMPLKSGERLVVRVPIAQTTDPQHRIGVLEHIRPGKAPEQGRETARNSEFEGRRQLGQGLHYDREQLMRTGDETLGDFLRSVPGLAVSDPNAMSSARMSRDAGMPTLSFRNGAVSSCHVGWFVDGHRMDLPGRSDPLTDGLGSMRMDTIDAIEVFRGLSEMPVQFADPDLRCGAIAVWMRRG
jgi:hypothetical protein